jgi:flagellar protein FlgJ
MAVSLPSDLIVDVMRNADPARRSAAVAKLDSAVEVSGVRFAAAFEDLQAPKSSSAGALVGLRTAIAPQAPSNLLQQAPGNEAAYQGFERLVLRNLFEALLPGEETGSFGGGPSAGIWRSMAADQLAGVYSESGGIGIASLVNGEESVLRRETQWPYFSKDAISTFRS